MWTKSRYICLGVVMMLSSCSGCILNVTSHTSRSGELVPLRLIDRLIIGETTKEWVIENFGPPSTYIAGTSGKETLRYEALEKERDHVNMLLIIDVNDSKVTEHVLTVEFKDGILEDYYQEERERQNSFGFG